MASSNTSAWAAPPRTSWRTCAGAGLRFVVFNPDVHCVRMGARSLAETEQNVVAVERGHLPEDLLCRLDEIASMVPYRLMREPFGIGWILGNPLGYKGPGA